MIAFTIDGRPRGKQRPFFGQGRAFTPQETRDREKTIKDLASAAMKAAGHREPLTSPVRMIVTAIFAVPATGITKADRVKAEAGQMPHDGKPDGDNILKLVADACNDVVFRDDGQIAEKAIRKRYGAPERVEVQFAEFRLAEPDLGGGYPLSPSEKRRLAAPWVPPELRPKKAKKVRGLVPGSERRG